MTASHFTQKKFLALGILAITFLTTSPQAYALDWRPLVTLSAGAASSPNVGQSKDFPATPPASTFFNYYADSSIQSSGVGGGFVGVEWGFNRWALQTGLAYNQTSPFVAQGSLWQGVDAGSADFYHYRYNIETRQTLLQTKILTETTNYLHPYLLVGVGASFNKAYNYSTDVSPLLTLTRDYENKTTTSFSYAIGMGIDIDVLSFMRLGFGYQFTDFGRVSLGDATIDNIAVDGTLSQNHLYANEFIVQLSFFAK